MNSDQHMTYARSSIKKMDDTDPNDKVTRSILQVEAAVHLLLAADHNQQG